VTAVSPAVDVWALLRQQVHGAVGTPPDSPLDDALLRTLSAHVERVRARVLNETPTGPYLEDPLDLAAYAAVLAPRTVAAVMAELPPLPPRASVLDLGAGGGAASLACAARGAVRFNMLDHGVAALRGAAALLSRVPGTEVRTTQARMGPTPPPSLAGRYDVVVMAFSLLECAGDHGPSAAMVVGWAERYLNPNGVMLIVDSAQPARARLVNGLRAGVEAAGLHVMAPCPHRAACPALERPRDFCHAARDWDLPADFRRAGEQSGLHRDRLTYAHLLASRTPPNHPPHVRIIGDVQKEKGRARVSVCSEGDARELVVLQRHKDAFRTLLELQRGDRVAPLPSTGERSVRVEDANALARLP
jgi:ribosomal protein RSM22 (predicted rRNA methylase)